MLTVIATAAICGSDLHMYEERSAAEPGAVFGHENMGVVEALGPGVMSIRNGDRVVLPFNISCGFYNFVLLAGIFPTSWHSMEVANVKSGDSVAIFGDPSACWPPTARFHQA